MLYKIKNNNDIFILKTIMIYKIKDTNDIFILKTLICGGGGGGGGGGISAYIYLHDNGYYCPLCPIYLY